MKPGDQVFFTLSVIQDTSIVKLNISGYLVSVSGSDATVAIPATVAAALDLPPLSIVSSSSSVELQVCFVVFSQQQ